MSQVSLDFLVSIIPHTLLSNHNPYLHVNQPLSSCPVCVLACVSCKFDPGIAPFKLHAASIISTAYCQDYQCRIKVSRRGRHPVVICAYVCVYVCKYFAYVYASVFGRRIVVKGEDTEGACGEAFALSVYVRSSQHYNYSKELFAVYMHKSWSLAHAHTVSLFASKPAKTNYHPRQS